MCAIVYDLYFLILHSINDNIHSYCLIFKPTAYSKSKPSTGDESRDGAADSVPGAEEGSGGVTGTENAVAVEDATEFAKDVANAGTAATADAADAADDAADAADAADAEISLLKAQRFSFPPSSDFSFLLVFEGISSSVLPLRLLLPPFALRSPLWLSTRSPSGPRPCSPPRSLSPRSFSLEDCFDDLLEPPLLFRRRLGSLDCGSFNDEKDDGDFNVAVADVAASDVVEFGEAVAGDVSTVVVTVAVFSGALNVAATTVADAAALLVPSSALPTTDIEGVVPPFFTFVNDMT